MSPFMVIVDKAESQCHARILRISYNVAAHTQDSARLRKSHTGISHVFQRLSNRVVACVLECYRLQRCHREKCRNVQKLIELMKLMQVPVLVRAGANRR